MRCLSSPDLHTSFATHVWAQVLTVDKRNVKALFRRGAARHSLRQTDEALADLVEANRQ